jgi:hypothetical protein
MIWLCRLNLTIASRIHILEPQWNPSVESQAIGRALRLGQEKEVTIIRYIITNTVEEVTFSGKSVLYSAQLMQLSSIFSLANRENCSSPQLAGNEKEKMKRRRS